MLERGEQVMLKVAVAILVVMLAYACVYSLLGIIVPKVLLGSTLKASGKSVEQAEEAGYMGIIATAQRNVGVFAMTTVISGAFVLFAAFRKAQRWAWWAFLVIGGVAWIGGLLITIGVGDKMNMILHLIGLVVFLVGLLLPVKEFFSGASGEA